jgi:TRAP-type mannitol/chloroaromatic compound transport system permease small subunit
LLLWVKALLRATTAFLVISSLNEVFEQIGIIRYDYEMETARRQNEGEL